MTSESSDEIPLPILQYKKEIVEKIRKNQIVLISGETGSGKTTKVPQFLYEDAKKRNEKVNILICQPRKIGAISIARRVSQELCCPIGGIVGYQVGLDKKLNKLDSEAEKTSLLFCTTGVVLQKLITEKNASRYTHIILDEVHERDIDIDLLMALIRHFISIENSQTRLILMSATLNIDKFAEYFPLNGEKPPIVKIETKRQFEIKVHYLDEIEVSEEVIDYSTPAITRELYEIASNLIWDVLNLKSENKKKSILVFLPGIYEIEAMNSVLQSIIGIQDLCLITVLYSQLSSAEQKEVFTRASLPKVILSTNIAESSITFPEVGIVIDFCLTKNIVVEKDSSLASLKLEWSSKYNCTQRAGRTGRTCDGLVYRLIHEHYFDNFILEETIPEILRVPLESTILHIKKLDATKNPSVMINTTMDPPGEKSIIRAIFVLKELGGLQIVNNELDFIPHDGELTYIGQIMAALPIDVRLSKLIVMGYVFSVLEDAIILAATLSVKSIFQNRFNKKMEDYLNKLEWAKGSSCDAIAMLNAYKFWLLSGSLGEWKKEQAFCNENGLERKNLHEVRRLVAEIKSRVVNLKMNESAYSWKQHEFPFILKICIAAAFYPNYFLLGKSSEEDKKEIYRKIIGLDPNRTIFFTNKQRSQLDEIYVENIKQGIIECGITSNNDMKITFDSSKIFVQFNQASMVDDEKYEEAKKPTDFLETGKIFPELYKSIKFRKLLTSNELYRKNSVYQSRAAIKFKILTPEEAQDYAIENDLVTETMGKLQIKKYTYGYPSLCTFPQLSQNVMHGKVTFIEHCDNFFFFPNELDPEIPVIKGIENSLKKATFKRATPKVGNTVIVQQYETYYRAKISKMFSDAADCYFFDYGYTKKIPFERIFEATDEILCEFFFFPERGFHCKLSKIEPSFAKCPRGKWTKSAVDFFSKFVENRPVEIEIYSTNNDIVSVELKVDDENVNEKLVRAGYAIRCEESLASRIDNEERENYRLTTTQHMNRITEFKNKENKMIPKNFPRPPQHKCTKWMNLEGPFSPLESRIIGLRKDSQSFCKVNALSVNSVSLKKNVESYEGQLLVAANINASEEKESTLHGVSLMPFINGMSALVSLIFAPMAVFECDENFTRILNIRTSLGFRRDNLKNSIFSSHEISLPVNVQIDKQDFTDINELRFRMSRLLKIEVDESVPNLTPEITKNLMAEINALIMKIFSRDRKVLKPADDVKKVIADSSRLYLKKLFPEFLFNSIEFPKLVDLI